MKLSIFATLLALVFSFGMIVPEVSAQGPPPPGWGRPPPPPRFAPPPRRWAPPPRPVYRPAPPPPRYCNIRACSNRYRSFRARDCSYQPYHGPRRLCRL